VHKYGTHIFHTASREVWDFLLRFTKWYPYQHKIRGLIDGQIVPIPFNLNSLHALFPESLADKIESRLIETFALNKKVPILGFRKKDDKDLEFLANYVYEKIFLEYTLKQWGLKPNEVDSSITERVPVYTSRDDRYLQDNYRGITMDGLTAMVKKMLDHPNIKVKLKTPYNKTMQTAWAFYTGAIGEFFDCQLGELPHRSINLDFVKFSKPRFQEAAVVSYPRNYIGRALANTNGFWTTKRRTRLCVLNIRKNFVAVKTTDTIRLLARAMKNYTNNTLRWQRQRMCVACISLDGWAITNTMT
jgi:UDP-galactopyranose mutase